jgi:hypothetical protein
MNRRMIAFIAEGYGEEKALPRLIAKILKHYGREKDIFPDKTTKNVKGKQNILRKGGLEEYLRVCKSNQYAGVLILIDADELCPKSLASDLYQRVKIFSPQIPVVIVCAKCEYETWFLANVEALVEAKFLVKKAHYPNNPIEDNRDAKKWLSTHMADSKYDEVIHQPLMTQHINIEHTAQLSRSFRRLMHAISELIDAIDGQKIVITPKMAD